MERSDPRKGKNCPLKTAVTNGSETTKSVPKKSDFLFDAQTLFEADQLGQFPGFCFWSPY